jgi:plasmid stabilization system protein ParE
MAVASRWWHRNRQKAPSAFDDDVAATIDEVRIEPGLGVAIAGTRRSNVRRVTVQRVRYYIYYRIDEEGSLVVLAIRHTSRRPPHRL